MTNVISFVVAVLVAALIYGGGGGRRPPVWLFLVVFHKLIQIVS